MTVLIAFASLAVTAAGCDSATIEANQQMVKEQQAQIEEMQRQIEMLKQGQNSGYSTAAVGASAPAGRCDRGVESTANQRGGDQFAARDFSGALGYYQDALTACPNDPRAELNVARAYEALGDKDKAVDHYRAAAKPSNGTITDVQEQARAALQRFGASETP